MTSDGINARAIGWTLAGAAAFSLVFASGKFAGEAVSAFHILWLRYVGGFLVLVAIVALSAEKPTAYRSPRPWLHFSRAFCGSTGGVAIIHASGAMPIVDATAIGLLQAVFVLFLGVMLLGERIGIRRACGILLCCGGAATMVAGRGAFATLDAAYLVPGAVALTGALLLALESYQIKLLAASERPMSVLLHVNAFGLIVMAVPGLLLWNGEAPGGGLVFLLLGPLAILAQYCIIRGYALADLSVVGPIMYSRLVFAALIGLIFFGEGLTAGTIAGGAAVLAGGYVLSLGRASPHSPLKTGLRRSRKAARPSA